MTSKKTVKRAKTAAEKLAAASRVRDSMTIYMPGPLQAEWKQLKAEYDRVKAASVDMLNPDPAIKKLAARLTAIEEQMREDAITVTVEARRRVRTPSTPKDELTWQELCDAHPPRKGKDGKPVAEDSMGVNLKTFPEALIRASLVDLDLDEEQLDTLLYEVITDAQWDGLFQLCWRLNRAPVDVPFSFAVSKTLKSGTGSRRQSGSGSPANASTAGNPER